MKIGLSAGPLAVAFLLALIGPGSASAQVETSVGVTSFSDSPDPVRIEEELTYTYVVRNSGSATANDVAVHTGVGPSVEFVSSEFFSGGGTGDCPPDEQGHITCRIGDLDPDGEATLAVVVRPKRLGHLQNMVPQINVGGFGLPGIDEFFSTFVLPPGRCTIVGTEGVDDLVGTFGRDVICAFGGNDSIRGWGGAATRSTPATVGTPSRGRTPRTPSMAETATTGLAASAATT